MGDATMARRFRTSGEGAEAMGFSATMRPTAVRIAKKVDFYRLPRPVQERFAAATRRTAPPAPLVFQKAARTRAGGCVGGGAAGAVVALVLLRSGWGEAGNLLSVDGRKLHARHRVL